MYPVKFVITGNPVVKKNSRPIWSNRKTGKPMIGKSKRLRGAESNALEEISEQKFRGFARYQHAIHIKFLFYRKDKRTCDLSNLYEFPQDVLQSAGIIKNDSLIESHDGSRKLYDPVNPRTEIYIYSFEGE